MAANFPEACTLLDLGITPVGRPAYMPSFAKYTRALGGVPMVTDSAGQLLLERVASLAPDLIVTADWADPKMRQVPYDKLRAIAPTAVFTREQAAGNWRDQATATAGAVNQADALAALRRKYLDRAAEIRRTHARLLAETRWDIVDASQNVWDLYSSTSSHGGVLT
ncbi:hypothetical protein GCM10023317_52110 [Actinopolymorpha pittospori]